MKQKLCIISAIAIFLLLSIFFQYKSKNHQISPIQEIPRGQLLISNKALSTLTPTLQKINQNTHYRLTIQTSQFAPDLTPVASFTLQALNQSLSASTSSIFATRNNQNFLTIQRSHGKVQAHGDSFYKVQDTKEVRCNRQVLESIELLSNGGFRIVGRFADCVESQYTFVFEKKNQNTHGSQYRDQLGLLIHVKNWNYNRMLVHFEHKTENKYYGLGEQFSHFNLGHGRPFSLLVRQKGVTRTDQPQTFLMNLLYGAGGSYYGSYSPAPIWISVFFDENKKSVPLGFIMNSNSYFIWMQNRAYIWDHITQFRFLPGQNVKQVLKGIAQFNGYTPPVPDWINDGAVVGLQGGTEQVIKKYEQLKKAGTKVTGLWLQDWVSKRKTMGLSRLWWNWELDRNHYKDWDGMREKLAKENVSLLIYINPMLTNVQGKKDNYTNNYYKEANKSNYFVKDIKNKVFETSAFSDWTAAMFNFSNPQAVKYYQKLLRSAIKQTGARGLMVDFGQAYPIQKHTEYPIELAMKLHNLYPTQYHTATKQVLNEFKKQQIYTFSRAGYLFTPKYTLSLWAGDQAMNFKKHSGLPSCLTAMLSSSLIGYSNTHCDIGGYSSYEVGWYAVSVRSEILMTRWMQLGAFSPVFRTHQGNRPQSSLQVYSNPTIAAEFAFYSRIFSLLSSYRKQQATASQTQKIPLIRPLFLQTPQTPQTYQINDQYYLGSDILVSPILTAKSSKKHFIPRYQPKPVNPTTTSSPESHESQQDQYEKLKHQFDGQWVNIWTSAIVEACDCYVTVYDALPPVLIKFGSKWRKEIVAGVRGIVEEFRGRVHYLRDVKFMEIQEL